jgi:hypothetical protein
VQFADETDEAWLERMQAKHASPAVRGERREGR